MIDSHCHIDDETFDPDRAAVFARAQSAGVTDIVAPAVSATAWPTLASLADTYPTLHPAYGLHPVYLRLHQPEHLERLDAWLTEHPAVAIGECGLDFHDKALERDAQHYYFDAHLRLAQKHALPLIIHARHAVEAVLQRLRLFPGVRGVLHSYSGSVEQALALHKLGFYFGLGGTVTWPNARRPQQLARELPLTAILLETDAPDQSDAEHRGERNEPSYLPLIAARIAELRGIEVAEVVEQTTRNARTLFAIH
ncbi:MAG: TatD family hydrolase [Thiotrichales bacterium]